VVNSNFDQLYLGGSVTVLDLDAGTVNGTATARVPGFGGVLTQRRDSDGALQDLLLASRLGDSVHRIQVSTDSDGARILSCNSDSDANSCDDEHSHGLISELGFEVEPYASTYIGTQDGRGVLAVAGLADGYLYLFQVDDSGAMTALTNLRIGSGVQSILFDENTSRLVFSHRTFPLLTTMGITIGADSDGELRVDLDDPKTVSLPSVSNVFDFGREMAIDPTTGRIALSWRSPSSVLILEADPSSAAGYKLVKQIPVGNGASGVTFGPFGPLGESRLFVSAFKEDKIYVVDPTSGAPLDILSVGAGPYALSTVNNQEKGKKLVISANFEANTVSVIEGDATKAGYMTVINEFPAPSED
jgi:DNA-binding beta-propeller fold protein YncE